MKNGKVVKKVDNHKNGKIRFVGFDMDGTLINTMSSSPKIFGLLISRKYGINRAIAERFFLETLGLPTYQQIQILCKIIQGITISKEEAVRLGDEVDSGLIKLKAEVFPDVEPVLKVLKNKGYRMFVSSSHKKQAILERLNEFKLMQYFDFLAGKSVDEPAFTKGEPHFRAAAKFFCYPYKSFCSDTVYIGDAKKDIEVAVIAGVKAVGRVGTFSSLELFERGAHDVVYDFKNLPEVISKIK